MVQFHPPAALDPSRSMTLGSLTTGEINFHTAYDKRRKRKTEEHINNEKTKNLHKLNFDN